MRIFFLDACAVARRYFDDIGSGNIRQIFGMSDSLALAPEIVKPEVVSTLISSYNGRFISRTILSGIVFAFGGFESFYSPCRWIFSFRSSSFACFPRGNMV